jgi:hypothetical protein
MLGTEGSYMLRGSVRIVSDTSSWSVFLEPLNPNTSIPKKMKEYVGAVNGRRGLEFNKSVGELFRADGWKVRLEVAMRELGALPSEASGDVDVLAWEKRCRLRL